MKKLTNAILRKFLFAIIFTLMFPVGILGIIFGATNGMTTLFVVGIVFAVLGFYGTPILWINFAGTKSLKIVLSLILEQNIYKVSDLAAQLSKNEKHVEADIHSLIAHGYLTGYLFKNGVLELNRNKKQDESATEKTKCPNCGGFMESDGVNFVCKYCGNVKRK